MIARKMRRDDETVRIRKRAPVLLLLNGFGWIGFCLEGISLSLSLSVFLAIERWNRF